MKVLVDTSVWSELLRRRGPYKSDVREALADLIAAQRIVMIGPIRQELLSGIRSEKEFRDVRDKLRAFPDLEIKAEEYEQAAMYSNLCRSKGLQGSGTDFLICAVAIARKFSLFTSDRDFQLYRKYIPLEKYENPTR